MSPPPLEDDSEDSSLPVLEVWESVVSVVEEDVESGSSAEEVESGVVVVSGVVGFEVVVSGVVVGVVVAGVVVSTEVVVVSCVVDGGKVALGVVEDVPVQEAKRVNERKPINGYVFFMILFSFLFLQIKKDSDRQGIAARQSSLRQDGFRQRGSFPLRQR